MIIGIALIWVSFFSVNLEMPKCLDFKPFNCIVCLSFWSCLFSYLLFTFVKETQPLITALEWGGFGAYTSIIMKRLIFKI